ncbi:7340_t:CDS:1 [Paraglomus occultum]|uniref:7340_t:CDS:1 n=1 Tax=Paraglomus occultum TaxID=144539 RepID=A0A9N9CR36_9GLOM|nr:7340_t:CDS:1 [Paraglomus occultum]
MDPERYEQLKQEIIAKGSNTYKIINNNLFVKHVIWKRVIKDPEHKRIIRDVHDLAHSGKRRTLDKIKELYWWPGMMNHVADYIESCDSCQRDTKPKHQNPLNPIPISGPWEIVGIDHVGPLPKSKEGYQYIIVAQDYLTKWPIAEPTKTTNQDEAIKFVRDRIMAVHGSPKQIITDQGAAFIRHHWDQMMELWKIKHVTTTAGHPQANDQVERLNQTIVKGLRRTLKSRKECWPDILQLILMDYRALIQDTTGYSPSQLLYGKQIRLPIESDFEARETEEDWDKTLKKRIAQLDLIEPNQVKAAENIKAKQAKMKARYDKRIKQTVKFQVGEQVLLYGPKRTKLETTATGPFRIRKANKYNSYELELLNGTPYLTVTGTRLRHYKDRSGNVHVDI